MPDVPAMRASYEGWKQGWKELHAHGCTPELLPVVTWRGREYAVVRGPRLQEGAQRVEAIDLTGFEEGQAGKPHMLAARFATSWPEQGRFPTFEGETEEQILRRVRSRVVYLMPDEGHCALLCEDGSDRGCDVWTVDFMVRVVPGTTEDARGLRQAVMDELEQSVDAGGRLIW